MMNESLKLIITKLYIFYLILEMALQYLDLNDERDSALINFLNPFDRGSDTVIIHPGSHSIKFGLAS